MTLHSNKMYKPFILTSICRQDLENEGYNTDKVDNGMMEELANKMGNAYMSYFWQDLNIICNEILKIPKRGGN